MALDVIPKFNKSINCSGIDNKLISELSVSARNTRMHDFTKYSLIKHSKIPANILSFNCMVEK